MHGAARRGSPQHPPLCSAWCLGLFALTSSPCETVSTLSFREGIHDTTKSQPRGFQMNKNDLISAVADASGPSKSDASHAVECSDTINKALSGGMKCGWVALGFSVSQTKALDGTQNPRKRRGK